MTAPGKIETGYSPRLLQNHLHRSLKRFNVLVCHRRFGKTVFCLNETIDKALRNELHNPQYAYLAPFYGQAKRVAWDYIKDFTKSIPGVQTNEADLRVDIPRPDRGDRIRIMLLGADNPASLRGIYLDGVNLDEYAEMDPTVWGQVIRPALADRRGWGTFIGTPKGTNHFYDIYQLARRDVTGDWFHCLYRASETGIVAQEELDGARLEMSEEEYDQEFECSFSAALVGAYYGKQMSAAEKEGRITKVSYDPAVPVDTWWDLGISDTTAIWFHQQVGTERHFIDYIEESGQGLDYYHHKLMKERPYAYGTHKLPHDANARELGTGATRIETMRKLGFRNLEVTPRQSIEDGIHASRMILPKSWFDADKCARGIDALKNYQRKYDMKNKIFVQKPLHDWASNGADAFRTGSMSTRDRHATMNLSDLPRQADIDYDSFGG